MSEPAATLERNAPLRAAAITAVMLAALFLSFFHVTDLDLGGHLAVGRQILKSGSIPSTDFFTHTVTGSPYPVHQWLGEVLLFGVKHLFGVEGLIVLRMLVVLAGAALLYRNARREDAPVAVAAGIVLLLLVAARPRFFVRPMLVTLVFLPLLHSIVAGVRSGRTRRLWPMLPLLAVWGHVHSGVLFGVLYLLGTLTGETAKFLLRRRGDGSAETFPGPALDGWNLRRLAMFSAISIALPFATMAVVNPSGVKPLVLPFLFFRNDAFRAMIAEYRPVDLAVDWPFDLVAGAVLLGCLVRPRRVDVTDLLVTAGFGVLAFQAVRGILPFAAASAALLGRTWGSLANDLFAGDSRGRGRPGARAALANAAESGALLAVIAAAALVSVRAAGGWMFPFGFGKNPETYPDRALDFVEAQGIRGHVFNTDIWASAILWRWPGGAMPIFVDARLEAYPEEFWRDEYYRVLQAAPGWREVLDRHEVQWAILRREGGEADDRIGEVLWEDPAWGLVYWDDVAQVFVRRDGISERNRAVLASWELTELPPRRPQAVQDLRGIHLLRAAAELESLIEWAPDSFLPRWCLAAAWTRIGRGEEAAALFSELAGMREARGNEAFLESRAEAELVAGRRDEWERLMREAGSDPDDPDVRFGAAALLALAGRREEAVALYEGVLEAVPGRVDAMNNLALLLAREDARRDEAMALIEEALRLAPGDGYVLASRAEIRWHAGDRAGARMDFLRALELIPDDDRAARAEIGGWLAQGEADPDR
jgi:tetratricopeptide (TPR) repeat protein